MNRTAKMVTAFGCLLVVVAAVGSLIYWQRGPVVERAPLECTITEEGAARIAESYESGAPDTDLPSPCAEDANRTSVYIVWGALAGVGATLGAVGLVTGRRRSRPDVRHEEASTQSAAEPASDTRMCPYCAEEVKAAAVKCKPCHSPISPAPQSP